MEPDRIQNMVMDPDRIQNMVMDPDRINSIQFRKCVTSVIITEVIFHLSFPTETFPGTASRNH